MEDPRLLMHRKGNKIERVLECHGKFMSRVSAYTQNFKKPIKPLQILKLTGGIYVYAMYGQFHSSKGTNVLFYLIMKSDCDILVSTLCLESVESSTF